MGWLLMLVNNNGQCSPDGVQEIYQDRKKFSEQVFKVASSDLVNMGIGVVSYTLKDVHDDQVFSVKSKREKYSHQWHPH